MTATSNNRRDVPAGPSGSELPLVSILMPAYNAQHWIGEAIESALAQTWPRIEIIVIDDGSTDRTFATAERFATTAATKTVTVVRQSNQGAAAARNAAFSLSRGSYIQWLDADDLLAPDKIATQMHTLQACEGRRTLVSGPWGRFLHRPEDADFVRTSLWCDLSPIEWLVRKMTDNVYMQTSAWLVSRELTEAAGPWNTRMLGDDDGEYFCRVMLCADHVRFVPEGVVYYRRAGFNSLSAIALSDRKMEADFKSVQLQIGYLRKREDSERVRNACVAYLQHSLDHYYPARLDLVEHATRLAEQFGGRLTLPRFSWKYNWLNTLFGPAVAKRAQIFLPRIVWTLAALWDRTRLCLETTFGRKRGLRNTVHSMLP